MFSIKYRDFLIEIEKQRKSKSLFYNIQINEIFKSATSENISVVENINF